MLFRLIGVIWLFGSKIIKFIPGLSLLLTLFKFEKHYHYYGGADERKDG